MMTSSKGNIFRVTSPLCGEFTRLWWISPQQRPVVMLSLICAWINGWVNNREAGELRRHRAHYDVTIMTALGRQGHTIDILCQFLRPLLWRHNERDSVSNHQRLYCLLKRLFRRRSKLRFTGLCAGNSPRPVNSPHKRPVTRKMLPFDDVIMSSNPTALGHKLFRQPTGTHPTYVDGLPRTGKSIIWTNDILVYRCLHTSVGLSE